MFEFVTEFFANSERKVRFPRHNHISLHVLDRPGGSLAWEWLVSAEADVPWLPRDGG
jgi:hypothetical protein